MPWNKCFRNATCYQATCLVLSLFATATPRAVAADRADPGTTGQRSLSDWTDPLSRTIVRTFENHPDYRPGDLIVHSQVEELQDYLRKTHGFSPATHPHLRRRVLQDRACLAKMFYQLGGSQVLREASQQLGSYEPLNQLCRSKEGRKILTMAVEQKDLAMILDAVQKDNERLKKVTGIQEESVENKKTIRDGRIYTLEEFLEVTHAIVTGQQKMP